MTITQQELDEITRNAKMENMRRMLLFHADHWTREGCWFCFHDMKVLLRKYIDMRDQRVYQEREG